MLIASYVYVQILFYYIIDKLFSKGVGGSSFGAFKKFFITINGITGSITGSFKANLCIPDPV